MSEFKESLRERAKQFERSKHQDQLFVLADIPAAIVRLNLSNPALDDLAQQISQGAIDKLPNLPLVTNAEGVACIDMSRFVEVFKKADVKKHGNLDALGELYVALDRDMVLRGESSMSTVEFQRERAEIARVVYQDLCQYNRNYVNFWNQLASEECPDPYEKPEDKEHFEQMQACAQSITDRLFATTGLKKYKPKVLLTRDIQLNAFVFGTDTGKAIREAVVENLGKNEQAELPIFIHTGLIAGIQNQDQLAGVLAHEFSHLLQPAYNETTGGQSEELSKRLEYGADAMGMKMADAAGFNPRALIDVFKEFPDQSRMQILFGGSHPSTQDRIIELEKLFNRTDETLSNAEKPLTEFDSDMHAAAKEICDRKRTKPAFFGVQMQEAEHEGRLAQLILENESSKDFISTDNIHEFGDVLKLSRQRAFASHEFQTGERGSRGFLSEQLQAMVLLFQKNGYGKQIAQYGSENRYFFPEFKEEELFAPMKDPEQYLEPEWDAAKKPDWNHLRSWGLEPVQKKEGIDLSKGIPSFETWLDPTSPEAKILWDLVEVSMKKPLSPEERQNYLYAMLRVSMDLNQRSFNNEQFGAVRFVEVKTKHVTHRPIPPTQPQPANNGHLSKLPALAGRAQMVKAQTSTQQYETVETESTSVVSDRLMTSMNVNSGIDFAPKLFALEETHAPVVQKSIDAYAQKGREALRAHLQERGITDVDDQDLNFYLRAEASSYPFDQESLSLTRVQKLLAIEESSRAIYHLYNNAEGTTRKNDYGHEVMPKIGYHNLRFVFLRLGAFALTPKTDAERAFQQSCLRRVELDPLFYDKEDQVVLGRQSSTEPSDYTSYVVKNPTQYSNLKGDVFTLPPVKDVRVAMGIRLAPMHEAYASTVLGRTSTGHETQLIQDPDDAKWSDVTADADMQKEFSAKELKALSKISTQFLGAVRGFTRDYFAEGVLTPAVLKKEFDSFLSTYDQISVFQSMIDRIVDEEMKTQFKKHTDQDACRAALEKWFGELTKKAFEGREYVYLANLIGKSQRDESKKRFPRIDQHLKNSMDWLAYRPPGISAFYEDKFRGEKTLEENESENKRFIEVITAEATLDPKKAKILAFVQEWQASGKQIGPMMRTVCMGTIVRYSSFKGEMAFADVAKLWRTVGEVYKEEWKDIEAFKAMDQQLSHWEWQNENPLVKFGWDKKGTKNRLQETLEYFSWRGAHEAGKVYTLDHTHTNEIRFSWPLFLEDVMKDKVVFSGDFKYSDKKYQDEFKLQIENLKHEMTKLIANRDPKVMETIMAMQPGFFKEYLLSRKLKKSQTKSLEQVEALLPHFTSRPHEGTERNQITSQIESKKDEIAKETKTELVKQAMRELGFPEAMIATTEINAQAGDHWATSLTGQEVSIEIPVYKNGNPYASPEKRREQEAVYDRYRKMIYEVYNILLKRKQREVRNSSIAREGDVRVFSDQVVEDEQNKLHIGPAYRLRMVSQPLMDWHSRALEGTKSAEETAELMKRVDKSLPEAHPLKDIFVKNGMTVELWQTIVDSIGEEQAAALGLSLEKKQINLDQVLEKLPLYKDISFLKSYTLIELKGLEDAITKLPPKLAKQIRDKIEHVMKTQISPDQYEGVRRTLMELEKRTVWPDLRKKRKGHPEVFDAYTTRITELYNEPSYARDDLLESIGMDLATTPDQIRTVWSLRYDEQMRLPKDTDSTQEKGQFHALEKMKAGLTFADRTQRAEYLIWFLGGEAPLTETFTSDKMNISLLDRKDLFWSLSPVERKSFLYDLLLGENGVMQLDPKRKPLNYGDYQNRKTLTDDSTQEDLEEYRKERLLDPMWQRWERPSDMIRYVADQVFDQMFGEQRIDAKLPADHETNVKGKKMVKTIFRELFVQQKEPARRAELFANIIEAIGSAKQDNVELTPGKLIKLLLEQVGVVGIKAGQVLSEQPDLLPESVRQELAGLKDQTTPFSKRGVLSIFESAGLVHGDESRISSIGDVVGSASIKQVLECEMEGKRVAGKFRRPSIPKNFKEDLAVMRRVFAKLEQEGFELPTYLVDEVERLAVDELNFSHEVDHQHAFDASLKKRDAHIGLQTGDEHRELPLTVAEVYVPPNSTEEDIGLIVEEFVRGFSVKELYGYRAALRSNNPAEIAKYREKLQRVYGDPSMEGILETRIVDLNLERFQADLGVEMLQQIQDGVIHADPHTGNVYIDLHPLEGRAILIDLGSVGYSEKSVMPEYLQAETEDGFDAKADFRDFITAFFGQNLRYDVIATVVQKYTSRTWTESDVRDIVGDVKETDGKVNKIFYALLKGGAEMHSQFRYLLKAIATGAGHLDQLKRVAAVELASEEQPEYSVAKTMFEKGLINVEMLLG